VSYHRGRRVKILQWCNAVMFKVKG
jgi:hypothetical protein